MSRLSWIMTTAAALAIASGSLGGSPELALAGFRGQASRMLGQ